MTEQNSERPGTRVFIIAAAIVIIIAGIYQAQSVLVPILMAIFLAMLGTPPVLWLERQRIPSFAAVLLVVAGMIFVLIIVGGLVGASLNNFIDAMPSYQQHLHEHISTLKALLAQKGIYITDKMLLEYTNPSAVMKLGVNMLGGLGSALSNLILGLLTVTFILLEASSFPIKLRAILGDPERAFPYVTKFVDDMKRYMIIKTGISLAAGILIGVWLSILGVDSPVLWGFLAFLFHYVPNVGSLIAAIPAVMLALVQLGIGPAAFAATGYLAVGFILGNLVEPWLMGQRLGLSTLVVFLSLIFWGSLLGLIGVVLCIPLTMTLKFVCEINKGTRWIAVLLGPETPPEIRPLTIEVIQPGSETAIL
jgi:predicted PurR-regulated permease PerM